MHTQIAYKKMIRESLKGSIALLIDNKEIVRAIYNGQHSRKKIIADWHIAYQLVNCDFELRIKPRV